MSENYASAFVEHLQKLQDKDRGAMATLRHSLAFAPGAYPKAYPYVERYAKADWHERDARRLALYGVAGLFARHPKQHARSFGTAFGELMRARSKPSDPNKSIEARFIALLGADPEGVLDHLRQAISLMATDGIGLDYASLLTDLSCWLHQAGDPERRDRLRQRWARDFYRALQADTDAACDLAPDNHLD